jgi:hypothetical protein
VYEGIGEYDRIPSAGSEAKKAMRGSAGHPDKIQSDFFIGISIQK